MSKIEQQVRRAINKMSMSDLLKFQDILNSQKELLSQGDFGLEAWNICMDLVQKRILTR